MTPKEQALKMIEGRIESIQNLSIECIEFIYKAAHNEAIDQAIKIAEQYMHSDAHNLEIEDLESLKL